MYAACFEDTVDPLPIPAHWGNCLLLFQVNAKFLFLGVFLSSCQAGFFFVGDPASRTCTLMSSSELGAQLPAYPSSQRMGSSRMGRDSRIWNRWIINPLHEAAFKTIQQSWGSDVNNSETGILFTWSWWMGGVYFPDSIFAIRDVPWLDIFLFLRRPDLKIEKYIGAEFAIYNLRRVQIGLFFIWVRALIPFRPFENAWFRTRILSASFVRWGVRE